MRRGRPSAAIKLHPSPYYRKDAFAAGFEALGFDIDLKPRARPDEGDVLVCWNRYARDEDHCRRYEAAGGHVLIAENAWLGPDAKDDHLFALCRGHHNGAGTWNVGPFPRQLIECNPWRENGEHILVLPQRGMGERGIAQPRNWLTGILANLPVLTRRPIRVHYHPGPRPHPPIDFRGAWAAVTWASGAALKAIVAGIPVFHALEPWIGAPAARFPIRDLENPFLGDRRPMLHRLSWAQWSADEIASGEAFKCLLRLA